MAGKPTYPDSVYEAILSRLADGEILVNICREKGQPCRDAVYEWKDKTPERKAAFNAARDDGDDRIIERARLTLRGKGVSEGGESTGDVVRDKAIAHFDLDIVQRRNKPRWSMQIQQHHSGNMTLEQLVAAAGAPKADEG